jgi:uncharacterized protein (TIGR01777 family)
MKVAIAGASGLIGSALVKSLLSDGHQVTKITRPGGSVGAGSILWEPTRGNLESDALEGLDAVVNLAGENIGSSRWTKEKKRRIRDSRVKGTALLASRLKILNNPPHVAVFASAFGYYGDRGEEILTEESGPGKGFLAELCQEWEAAADPLDTTAIRRVHLRTGLVLSSEGGLLDPVLPFFKLGLGGKLGSGDQWMSWISRDDLVGIIRFAIDNSDISGPINAMAPEPVRNKDFTRAVGKALRRPTPFRVPGFAVRIAMGDLADEIMASIRAVPKKLEDAGFVFKHPGLAETLAGIL